MSALTPQVRALSKPRRNLLEALAIELLSSIEYVELRNSGDINRALQSSDWADELGDLTDDELAGLELLALALQSAAIRQQNLRSLERIGQ